MSSILQPRMQFRRLKPRPGARLIRGHPHTRGLVCCLPFIEAGGDKVYDLSGHGNHGTLTNMAFPPTTASGWNPGTDGPVLIFDGSNDVITVVARSSINFTGQTTFACRIKPSAYDVDQLSRITARQDYACEIAMSGTGNPGGIPSGNLAIYTPDLGWDDTGYHLDLNNWYRILFAFDSTYWRAYVNGVLQWTSPSTTVNISGTLYIGDSQDAVDGFSGVIDNVLFYERGLVAQEALELALNPYGMFEWPMPWLGAAVVVGNPWYAYAQQH